MLSLFLDDRAQKTLKQNERLIHNFNCTSLNECVQ